MAQKKYASYATVESIINNIKNLFTKKEELNTHTSNADIHFSATERTKLKNIQAGAQVNTITGVKGNSESTYRTGNVNITKANIGLGNVDNTSDANKPVSTAQQTAIDAVEDIINTHKNNGDIHVTTTNKSNWNAAHTHSTSAHAPSDAQKNQNAFSNVKIGSTTIAADTTTDTLELVGSNVTITPDATNDKVTISVADASTSAKGVVQLTDSTSSTSTTTAATPKSVKSAYDLANQAKTATDTINTELDAIRADYLPKAGGTVTGTTVFNKVQDAVADAYNAPAVVIGGNPSQAHLELDNNEIQAKQNETKAGNLFLNSNGGTVHVGFDGLKVDAEGVIIPEDALSSSVGTSPLPFNHVYGRYFNLYGAADTQYGRFRVGTTGTTSTAGVTTLELGNNKATGTAHNASGKITVYGSGTGFTNVLPKTSASGSNSIYLPSGTGTLALEETSTKAAVMTNAEYEALTPEEVNANTLYMITDAEEENYVTPEDLQTKLDEELAQKSLVQIITWEDVD